MQIQKFYALPILLIRYLKDLIKAKLT